MDIQSTRLQVPVENSDGATTMTEEKNIAFRLRWDVFLSFRGEDTRECFTISLFTELARKGVRVFLDDAGLDQGDEIAPSLIEAIEDSAAAIAIISPNYASSRWCLEELATICESPTRLLLPVFFDVDPSDVRRQKGPFEDHFRDLEKRFDEPQILRWRDAMKKAGGIKGQVFQKRDGEEAQLIQLLVRRILAALSRTPMDTGPYIVGQDFRLEELTRMLVLNCSDVRVLGLHGLGGVGKTTLAKALYNKLVDRFEYRGFILNIRDKSLKQDGLASLQSELLHSLRSPAASPANDVSAGKAAIKRTLRDKRVFLVLDDVDDAEQLKELFQSENWFSKGSRIIITTRNREVLLARNVREMYEVRELGSDDALRLFSFHALRREKPTQTFMELSKQIVSLTGGLPLALEVFGSFLFDKRTVEVWKDALQKLNHVGHPQLHDVLKISFDGLGVEEKRIFLDIACLFINLDMKRDNVVDILKGCGFGAEAGIDVLVAKSLLKIGEDDVLRMHDQIRDMGRKIVDNEDPGKCSRLWDPKKTRDVLEAKLGTRCIEGIILDFEKNTRKNKSAKSIAWGEFRATFSVISAVRYLTEMYKEYWDNASSEEGEELFETKAFERMVCLRLLQMSNVKLKGDFGVMPPGIKWLQWRECPLRSLPSSFCPQQLTVLDLSRSKIKDVWGQRWWWWSNKKVTRSLRVLNLYNCYNLTAIPNLSCYQTLEKLNLELCTCLTRIHKSLGDMSTLHYLNLRDCHELVDFPEDVSGLKHLEILLLSGCSKLAKLPENMYGMTSLKELFIDKTAIEKLPESIFRLTKLETLNLDHCRQMKRLPHGIGQLVSLRDLSLDDTGVEVIPNSVGSLEKLEKFSLRHCTALTVLPDSVGNLKSLSKFWLTGSSVKELPASIGSLFYLEELSVGNCRSINLLPASIGGLASIIELQLDWTSIKDLPDEIDGLKSLQKLEMRNCKYLTSLPESIGRLLALTTLIILDATITELPESIGMLDNLTQLKLNKCKKLNRLPSSIGKLKSLVHLHMEETAVTELPESFGMLSSLMILKMGKKPYQEVNHSVESTLMPIVLPPTFSNLSLLEEFNARAWRIAGKISDDFEKLSSLEILNLSHNDFHSLPCSLRGLSILRKLFLSHCRNLRTIPPLPSTLQELDASNCISLENIHDVSNLESLQDMNLANCEKLLAIPGLECLQSLRNLFMGGCRSCSSVTMAKLDKLALRKIYNLSAPGSEIPTWFTHEMVCYSKPRNRSIKAIIIGIVISINHQMQDYPIDQDPVVAGIVLRILRLGTEVLCTWLYLRGVPKTVEDQFYLCRYEGYHLSFLEDGDKIQVKMQCPAPDNGVQLKKSGIHLVFEYDDDYVGDEKSLEEPQQSVSHKLNTFLNSPGEGSGILDSVSRVERENQGSKQKEELKSSNLRRSFLFVALPCLFLLSSHFLFKFYVKA
ncbi:hypothetical protein NMG60_11007267 [Bertholletia excelsa]